MSRLTSTAPQTLRVQITFMPFFERRAKKVIADPLATADGMLLGLALPPQTPHTAPASSATASRPASSNPAPGRPVRARSGQTCGETDAGGHPPDLPA